MGQEVSTQPVTNQTVTPKLLSLAFKDWPIRRKLLTPTILFLVLSCTVYILAFFFLLNHIRDEAITAHKALLSIERQFSSTINTIAQWYISLDQVKQELIELELQVKHYQSSTDSNQSILVLESLIQNIHRLNRLAELNVLVKSPDSTQYRSLVLQLEQIKTELQTSIHKIQQRLADNTTTKINFLMLFVLLSALIGAGLAIYGANIIAYKISTPIQQLHTTVVQFRHGKDTQKLTIEQDDEIGQLTKDFNSMIAETTFNKGKLEQAIKLAQQSNHAKSQFLANISHELRTPMLGIMGFSDLGIDKIDSADKEKLLRYFQRIKSSSKRLLDLVNDLLDLSKLESGQLELHLERFDLSTLTKEVIDEMRTLIRDKSIDLSLEDHKVKTLVNIDRKQIHQVIYNLLSNAIKYSEVNGNIRITIDTCNSRIEQNNRLVEIPCLAFTCADEGVGIPEDELDVVFDKFTQSTKTVTGAGGTGLGLAICKEIIEAHQGRIYATNRRSGGVQLTFEIPV